MLERSGRSNLEPALEQVGKTLGNALPQEISGRGGRMSYHFPQPSIHGHTEMVALEISCLEDNRRKEGGILRIRSHTSGGQVIH
jgi:hypothetical protein